MRLDKITMIKMMNNKLTITITMMNNNNKINKISKINKLNDNYDLCFIICNNFDMKKFIF